MFQETILVTGAAGSVGSTAHTAIATLLERQWYQQSLVGFRNQLDGYVASTDLHGTVRIVTIKAGQQIEKWRLRSLNGGFFTYAGADPARLGFDVSGREREVWEAVKDFEAIETTAAPGVGPGGGKHLVISSMTSLGGEPLRRLQ